MKSLPPDIQGSVVCLFHNFLCVVTRWGHITYFYVRTLILDKCGMFNKREIHLIKGGWLDKRETRGVHVTFLSPFTNILIHISYLKRRPWMMNPIKLFEKCSPILQTKILIKCKGLKSIMTHCTIRRRRFNKYPIDLGYSVSLILLYINKKLDI